MSEILVLGGVHGNEPLGPALVQSLHEAPIQGVDALIANERATEAGVRFIENELSADSDPAGTSYEDRRFAELIEACADYPLILDFHNAAAPDTYEAWMNPPAEQLKKPVQWFLGEAAIRYVIKFNQDWRLYTALPQTITIEQGLPARDYLTWEKQQIERWRSLLTKMISVGLGNLSLDDSSLNESITYLELVDDIKRQKAKQCSLEAFASLQRYDALPEEAATMLGLEPANYRVLSWGYRNMSKPIPGAEGEREYWGQLVKEVMPFVQ